MSCFGEYKIIKELGGNISFVEDQDGIQYTVKRFRIKGGNRRDLFETELRIARMAEEYDIGPKIYGYRLCDRNFNLTIHDKNASYAIIIMEKLDITIKHVWKFFGPAKRREITDKINRKIMHLHILDIAHGDLHANNIMYKEDVDDVYIIDYGSAFTISSGRQNQRVIDWMEGGFNWEGTYVDFVNHDYINWQEEVSDIKPSANISFETMFELTDVGSNNEIIMSLSKKIGWPLYGVYKINLRDYNDYLPIHLLLKTPGEYYVDIQGIYSTDKIMKRWKEENTLIVIDAYVGELDEPIISPVVDILYDYLTMNED